MILTEDEIREEVSIKPSIKQKLTDCKKYPFQWHVKQVGWGLSPSDP